MSRSRRTVHSRIAVLALTALLGALAACGPGSGAEQFSMPASNADIRSSASPLSSVEMEPLSTSRSAPVYWLSESDGTVSLYREFVSIPGAGDPIAASVRYMLSAKPQDPAYFNLWRPSQSIGASVSAENVITLDLEKKAFAASLDRGLAERSIAQLVYTATAAASNAGILSDGVEPSVKILVDGSSDFMAFGKIPLEQAFTREVKLAAPLWIIDPQFGSTQASGHVTFHGLTASFTGGEYWSIARKATKKHPGVEGEVIASGRIHTGGDALDSNEFSFSYMLDPGEYVFSAWGVDKPSGMKVAVESKTFTVQD